MITPKMLDPGAGRIGPQCRVGISTENLGEVYTIPVPKTTGPVWNHSTLIARPRTSPRRQLPYPLRSQRPDGFVLGLDPIRASVHRIPDHLTPARTIRTEYIILRNRLIPKRLGAKRGRFAVCVSPRACIPSVPRLGYGRRDATEGAFDEPHNRDDRADRREPRQRD